MTQDGFRNGVFSASAASAIIGPAVDQAEIVADFDDAELQDRADAAIHRFVSSAAHNAK